MRNYLELGSWNVVCDRCGYEYKHHQLRKEWTGLMVCHKCYEPRHPQTLIKAPPRERVPSWVRPEPADVVVAGPDFILTENSQPIMPEVFPPEVPLQTES